MSYVKVGIIENGVLDTVEVHGSEMFMSCKKRINNVPEWIKKEGKAEIEFFRQMERSSGIIEERRKRGIGEVDIEKKLKKWLQYLREEVDIADQADGNGEYPYNCILDVDSKVFYSMQRNWYANYSRAVADGWEYKEVTVEEMHKLIDNLPVAQRERKSWDEIITV
jgi:hypothetical protein